MHLAQLRRASWLSLFGTVAFLAVAGCGGQTLNQVKGKVVYKDGSDISVLANGQVLFDPADPEAPIKASARGDIQPDGTFVMSTKTEGDGVVPGTYRVAVTPPHFFGKRGQQPPRLLDPLVQDFETSELSIEVNGPRSDYVITVQKP